MLECVEKFLDTWEAGADVAYVACDELEVLGC